MQGSHATRTLDTDVVVIGGGSAGAHAAALREVVTLAPFAAK